MRLVITGFFALLLATGCHEPGETVLGKKPTGEPRTVQSIKTERSPAPVTLRGTVIEKCPVAGCWFRLRDGTGIIKVDTKTAGFVVVDVPLETQVTVSGKVVGDGTEAALEATGLRY